MKLSIKDIRGSLILLTAALVWGCAFVAQSSAMDHVGPFTYTAARSFLGSTALLPMILVRRKAIKKMKAAAPKGVYLKNLIKGGLTCGVIITFAAGIQQVGIQYTTVGKAGFITALYILIVPLFGLIMKQRVPRKIWLCIAVAVIGLYLLCINGDSGFSIGDILILICAVAFSLHIIAIDKFSPLVDGVSLSCIQFFVCGVISTVLMLIFETPNMASIIDAWLPIAYGGIMSCGVAYTLQIIGQKYASPVVASLTMSTESVFSVIAGIFVLGQMPSPREWAGCALMFAAIIFAQIPQRKAKPLLDNRR